MLFFIMRKEYNFSKNLVLVFYIVLKHNEEKHVYNLINNIPGENLLWTPENQEIKYSQYGGKNLRYNSRLKAEYIKDFVALHDSIIPWNTIRYIF